MDSTLVAGLLSRLDVAAQKVGVGTEALWDLWIATSWRPLLDVLVLSLMATLLLVSAGMVFRKARADSDWEESGVVLGVVLAVVGGIMTFVAAFSFPNAVAFIAVPELYALEQLKDLLGVK